MFYLAQYFSVTVCLCLYFERYHSIFIALVVLTRKSYLTDLNTICNWLETVSQLETSSIFLFSKSWFASIDTYSISLKWFTWKLYASDLEARAQRAGPRGQSQEARNRRPGLGARSQRPGQETEECTVVWMDEIYPAFYRTLSLLGRCSKKGERILCE